jgi:hypothetical protein
MCPELCTEEEMSDQQWKLLEALRPAEAQQCWISNGTDVRWAVYSERIAGGWSDDTWTDVNREYNYWQPANPPAPPPGVPDDVHNVML